MSGLPEWCLFIPPLQALARKLFQHASGKNVGERSYDAEKTCQIEQELPLR